MTGKVVDFFVVADGKRALNGLLGGDPDTEFVFDMPDNFLDDEETILAFRVERKGLSPQLSVAINGSTVISKLPLDECRSQQEFPRYIHEFLGERVLRRSETNSMRFTANQGIVDISDVVLWIRTER